MTKFCLLTNDVETTSIWFNTLRDDTGFKVLSKGMPTLLSLYEKYRIKTTFFFTGYIAKLYPKVVRMVLPYGHEVGSHGLSHRKEDSFDALSLNKQIYHLKESKKILEDLAGEEVITFRSPALRISENTGIALCEADYKIDSSIASQRFDMFMSFGGLKKMKWLVAPRLPYRAAENDIFRKGSGSIIEVPLSALGLPYVGTTMRIFPVITNLQKRLLNLESGINNKPIVFVIHPNEFIDESDEERVINRRDRKSSSYFLQDVIRSRLKKRNLGQAALPLYENQISYFIEKGYNFCTIKDYVLHQGFEL